MLQHGTVSRIAHLVSLTVVSLLVSCASLTTPSWVIKGSAAMKGQDQAFYGVGAVTGTRNAPLAWEAAETRARAQIVREIQTYTAYLMRDYAAATANLSGPNLSDEQQIERAIKTFSAMTLTGVTLVDRYVDNDTMTYSVLVKLDLARAKEMLDQAKELNEAVKAHIRKNADRLFERLEHEEQKRGQ